MLECWHLTADSTASLMKDLLLLAEMHASLGLAQSLQPDGAFALDPKTQQQLGEQLCLSSPTACMASMAVSMREMFLQEWLLLQLKRVHSVHF